MNKNLLEEINDALNQYRQFTRHIAIDDRKKVGEVTAEELNEYSVSKGFLDLGNAWTELSFASANQHLRHLLFAEIGPTYTQSPEHLLKVSSDIAIKFTSSFDKTARFFCNGLYDRLDEYPIMKGDFRIYVSMPFYSNEPVKSQYRAWTNFLDDHEKDLLGIVVVDIRRIGLFLINPNWMSA